MPLQTNEAELKALIEQNSDHAAKIPGANWAYLQGMAQAVNSRGQQQERGLVR